MRLLMLPPALGILGVLVLAGCVNPTARGAWQPTSAPTNLVDSTAAAVDRLLTSMNPRLSPDTTVLVASFADLNELGVSTKLGRLIAEQTAEHLIQRGFQVPEVRLSSELHVREGGEFILTSEVNELRNKYKIAATVVVAGTITSVGGTTYVNFRLIRLDNGIALSASDLELPDRIANR
jgi:uncharacterized lipoprotein YajG